MTDTYTSSWMQEQTKIQARRDALVPDTAFIVNKGN